MSLAAMSVSSLLFIVQKTRLSGSATTFLFISDAMQAPERFLFMMYFFPRVQKPSLPAKENHIESSEENLHTAIVANFHCA